MVRRFSNLLPIDRGRVGGRYLAHAEYFLNGGRMYGPPGPRPAAEQLVLALRAGETDAVVFYALGVAYHELSDHPRACAAFLEARARLDGSATPAARAAIDEAVARTAQGIDQTILPLLPWLCEPFQQNRKEHTFNTSQQRFEYITDRSLRATLSCGGTKDFFSIAEAATETDPGLTVEILEAAVNYLAAPNAKAIALGTAAVVLARVKQMDEALQYAEWAEALGPSQPQVTEMVAKVRQAARMPDETALTPDELDTVLDFDLTECRFIQISPEARQWCEENLGGGNLTEAGLGLAQKRQGQLAVEVLKLAVNEAPTSLDRHRALRALARQLHVMGHGDDAARIAGLAVGDSGPPLGPAGRRAALEDAHPNHTVESWNEAVPHSVVQRLARTVEEIRACGHDAYLIATKRLCELCIASGSPSQAEEAVELFHEDAESAGATRPKGLARVLLADLRLAQGRVAQARLEIERACASQEGLPPHEGGAAGWIYLKRATLESEIGQRTAAIDSARRAIVLAGGANDSDAAIVVAESQLLLARLLDEIGQDEEVAKLIRAASVILPKEAAALHSVCAAGRIYRQGPRTMEALETAFASLREAERHMPGPAFAPSEGAWFEWLRSSSPEASSPDGLLLEAMRARARGDFTGALQCIDKAYPTALRRDDYRVTTAEILRAKVLLELKRPHECLEAGERGKRSAVQRHDFSARCEAELVCARAEAALGQESRANERIDVLLALIAGREDHDDLKEVQARLAAARVENLFVMGSESAEEHYAHVRQAMLQQKLEPTLADLDRRLGTLLLNRQRPNQAVKHALSALELDLGCMSDKNSAFVLDARESLRLDAELAFTTLIADSRPGEAASVVEQMRSSAVVQGRRYTGSTARELAESLQQAAKDANVVAWQVVGLRGPLRCLIHSSGSSEGSLLFTSGAQIETLVDLLGEIYEWPSATAGNPMPSLRRGAHTGLKKLYDLLFRTEGEACRLNGSFVRRTSIEAELTGTALRLLLQGPLELVPFAGLITSDAPLAYLVDKFDLAILPYLPRVGDRLDAPSPVIDGALLIGDTNPLERPLPGAHHECTSVAALLADAWGASNIEVRLGHSVEGDEILGGSARRLLHIAAHAAFDMDRPFSSGVDLGAGRTLQIDAVAGANFAYDTVVLSGCDTSATDLRRTITHLSLASAFVSAGAKRAIGSVWAVNDAEAPDLMLSVYRDVLRGTSWSRALSQAQRVAAHGAGTDGSVHEIQRGSLRARPLAVHNVADPYIWAGFRCVEAP